MPAATTLHRDPRTRGQIGGRYYATAAGRRYVIEGTPGLWSVSIDLEGATTDELRAYIADPDAYPATVELTLAAVRAWLADLDAGAVR